MPKAEFSRHGRRKHDREGVLSLVKKTLLAFAFGSLIARMVFHVVKMHGDIVFDVIAGNMTTQVASNLPTRKVMAVEDPAKATVDFFKTDGHMLPPPTTATSPTDLGLAAKQDKVKLRQSTTDEKEKQSTAPTLLAPVPNSGVILNSNIVDTSNTANAYPRYDRTKPVPAVMCTDNMCNIQACQDAFDFLKNSTDLPHYMRPFPTTHYGYGFVRRAKKENVKAQISGTANSGGGCAMSHKYGFIFVHVLKSGGTTVKGFLQVGLCGSLNLPCERGKDMLEIVDCAPSIRQYPHYFVFTFVRNPYARAYSAYAMAMEYRWNPRTPKPPFSFETFALGRHPNSTELKHVQSKSKFRSILSYLHPSHYVPQTRYLFSGKDCPVVDFIGHLESMDEDLKAVLTYLGSPELWHRYEHLMRNKKVGLKNDNSTAFGSAKKKKELGGSLHIAYGKTSSDWTMIQESVAKEYQRDFHLLGYDPNFVPA